MKKWILMTAIAAALSTGVPGIAQTPAPKTADPAKTSKMKKTVEATPAPTEQDIASAKSSGMVWVNTSTRVYHKDGEFFGKTKKGKFMTEEDAKKVGFKAAKEPTVKKAKTLGKSDPKPEAKK